MYVVRRSFRNFGNVLTPGTVVQPGDIKRFKTKLKERTIVSVPEQDFDKWNTYFISKFGTPIALPDEKPEGEPEKPEGEPEKPEGEPEKPVVAAVIK